MTSFDRPRALSSPALAPKLVAASTTAIIQKDPASDFGVISNLFWLCAQAITPSLARKSAMGQKRRLDAPLATSGLPSSTDIASPARLVRFVPTLEFVSDI
jgi:hypothetical protein